LVESSRSFQTSVVRVMARLGAQRGFSTLSMIISMAPSFRAAVMDFRHSSSLPGAARKPTERPVVIMARTCTKSEAPVPALGLSMRPNGTPSRIKGRTTGVKRAARALAREALTRRTRPSTWSLGPSST
jgi:hypothetical protein